MSTDLTPSADLLDSDYPVQIPDEDKVFLRTLATKLKASLRVLSQRRSTTIQIDRLEFKVWDSGAWIFRCHEPFHEAGPWTSPSPAAAYRSYLSVLRERIAGQETYLRHLESAYPTKESS